MSLVEGNRKVPVRFKNYSITILPGLTFVRPQLDDDQAAIIKLLKTIEANPVGLDLLKAITRSNSGVGITYAGKDALQTAGGQVGYYQLRRAHENGNAAFGQELTATIQRMTLAGYSLDLFVDELCHITIPTWNGGSMQSPFRATLVSVLPVQGARDGRPGIRPQPPRQPIQPIRGLLNAFMAGTQLPNYDQMDALVLALEPWMTPGDGCNSNMYFDPLKEWANGQYRPPYVALYHELVHAYYYAVGRQLGREDSSQEDRGGRLFEAQAVGLGKFKKGPFNENRYRDACGVPLRTQYP